MSRRVRPQAAKAALVSAPVAAGPSIAGLGAQLASVDEAFNQQQRLWLDSKGDAKAQHRAQSAMDQLNEQAGALRDLIFTMPARSLADVAVQLSVANLEASGLIGDGEPDAAEVVRTGRLLERITVSAIPVIAAAANLDLVALNLDQYVYLHSVRFPPAEIAL